MRVSIRHAAGPDIPYLYEICLKTGLSGKNAENMFSDRLMIGQYYAAPYYFFQPEFCFVAEENKYPQGYIIGTSDSFSFYPWFETQWLPLLRKRYPPNFPAVTDFERHIVTTINRPVSAPAGEWAAEYPAHLHIDLLPTLQGKGCGRILMQTLAEALLKTGVSGVHLGVGAENTGATAFYKKMGFSVLEEEEWGLIMGLRLK